MHRLLVFALVASLGNVSMVFAGASILKTGARHVQQIAAAEATAPAQPSTPAAFPAGTVATTAKKTSPSYQQDGGTLSKSGMSKRTKIMLYTGLAVGFVASVWAIDHHVLDITPSSLGTRQD
jgi:hypothetical protein